MRFIYTQAPNAIMIVDSQNGETHSIPMEEEFRYKEVKEAIKNKELSKLEKILYPENFFIFPDFKFIGNSLYLKGEKLPNEVSLSFIKNQEEFKGLYNYWITSSKNGWEENKIYLIDLIMANGYPITDDGFYFVHSSSIINNDMFYSYSNWSYPELTNLFKEKLKIEDILKESFGVCTNKLKKTVLNLYFKDKRVNPSYYIFGKMFKNVMKLENIIRFLTEEKFINFYIVLNNIGEERVKNIISFIEDNFKNKEKRLINLLDKEKTFNSLVQCVSLFSSLKTKVQIDIENFQFSSFEELYQKLLEEEYKLKNKLEFIDVPKNFPALIKNPKALKVEGYDIIYPRSNYELIIWSQRMNNCIRGYTTQANSPDYLILALMDDDRMFINLEFRKIKGEWKIIQFKKYGNSNYETSQLAKSTFNHVMEEIVNWVEPPYRRVEHKPFKFKENPVKK